MPWLNTHVLRTGAVVALLLAIWEIIWQIEPQAVLLSSPVYYAAIVAAIVGFHMSVFLGCYAALARWRPGAVATPRKSAVAALLLATAVAVLIELFLIKITSGWLAAVAFLAVAAVVVVLSNLTGESQPWRVFWSKAASSALAAAVALLIAIWWVIYFVEPETAAESIVPCLTYGAAVLLICAPLLMIRPLGSGRIAATVAIAASFLLPIRVLIPSNNEPVRQVIGPGNEVKIPRVVLIIVDTLRADAVSAINPGASTRTPRLDEFAADAVLFENAISPAPWTFPSVAALMTGVAPYIDRHEFTYDTAPLPTISGQLASSGYNTRALLGNQLIYRAGRLTDGVGHVTSYAIPPLGYTFFRSVVKNLIPGRTRAQYPNLTRRLTDRAGEWLVEHRNEPAFLWLHYMDPHDPYAPPLADVPENSESDIWLRHTDEFTPQERDVAKSLYDAEVEFVDSEIGRLLDGLKEAGLYDESLIIFTSDHGEEFLDHGGAYHGSTLYQELVHVPLIVRLPGGRTSGVVSKYVPTRAIMPTIMELCEVDVRDDPLWTESLTAAIFGDDDVRFDKPIISAGVRRGEFQRSVVLDGMKFIVRIDSGKEELYDLADDPHEKRSVLADHPEVVAKAKEALTKHETQSAVLRAEFGLDGDSTLDADMLNRLKSLGYIQ